MRDLLRDWFTPAAPPPPAEYVAAFRTFVSDGRSFALSLGHLLYICSLPLLNLLHDFHSSKSPRFLLCELLLVFFLLLCYLARRHIIRKKYIPRLYAALRQRRLKLKRAYKKWYDDKIRKIVKINKTLAAVAPHAAFALGVFFFHRLVPDLARWLVRESWATVFIGAIVPLGGTIGAIIRAEEWLEEPVDGADGSDFVCIDGVDTVNGVNNKETPKKKTTKKATPRTTRTSSTPITPSTPSAVTVNENDLKGWTQYWVVTTLLQAANIFLGLLPIVGNRYTSLASVYSPEITLWTLVWLQLPEAGAALLLYGRLEPLVARLVMDERGVVNWFKEKSPSLVSGWESMGTASADQNQLQQNPWIPVGLRKFAYYAVMTIRILKEWLTLIPAIITLFSPTFLTSYGLLYARFIVPAGGGAISGGTDTHWLKYWVAQCVSSAALSTPIVAMLLRIMPLSTHALLVFYIYLQQRVWGGGVLAWEIMINEMIGLGFFKGGGGRRNRIFSERISITSGIKKVISARGLKKLEEDEGKRKKIE